MSDPVDVYVCVALYRDRRWLLTARGTTAAHAPDVIGLVGGHLEPAPAVEESEPALLEERVLENNARREVLEETGIDLAGVELTYLGSELFRTDAGPAALAVTFVAEVPDGVEPVLAAPEELEAVGWWKMSELVADPRCPPWTLRLVREAAATLTR